MVEDVKTYVQLIKKEQDEKHNFSILMHTICKEEYSSKLKSFYGVEQNVRDMLDLSNSCIFFDNESENKFTNWISENK